MAKKPASARPVEPAPYKKHQAPKEWNTTVIRSTRTGPALFKPDLVKTELELCFEYQGAKPIGQASLSQGGKFWKQMPYVVGASQGVETTYLLFKIDGGYVHARPVSPPELRRWGVKVR